MRFTKVHMWGAWRHRATVSEGGKDVGVDLVAEQVDGSWCAIQCKCYADDGSLNHRKLSTFFNTADMIAKKHGKNVNTVLVYTGDRYSPQAEKDIDIRDCHVIGQDTFRSSRIEWGRFPKLEAKKPKKLKEHQEDAMQAVVEGLKNADRGKLIMACGTGKTLTALRIAEKMVGAGGTVLYLVPSISLVHQTLREWSGNAEMPHHYAVACSDATVGRTDEDGGGDVSELPFPPTTDAFELKKTLAAGPRGAMKVLFSTYHSVGAAAKAAVHFDLVLCDEAHRTTGVEKAKSGDRTHFTMVHHDKYVKARKRLYMTATPRVYGEAVQKKADVHSMDDPAIYGEDLHVYSFPAAVDDEELADFKVRIPVVPEEDLQKYTDEAIDGEGDTIDERVLLAAVWHALNHDGEKAQPLLQRVISFSNKIAASRQFAGVYVGDDLTQDEEAYAKKRRKEDESRMDADRSFAGTVKEYERTSASKTGNTVSVRHMDGSMRSSIRGHKLGWLKASDQESGECRILSNARCLSEGVDVPSLDGIIFLQPRKSKTDVIQAVGRVMRTSPRKKYGYVILPVVIPAGMSVEASLHDKKVWKTVWQVLAALRSHNPNFASEINRVNLDRSTDGSPSNLEAVEIVWMGSHHAGPAEHEMFGKLLTRMVEKVGDRAYYEDRSQELGSKARELRDILRIAYDRGNARVTGTVDRLRDGLRHIVNDSVNHDSTIDVLAQHHALSQVFDALFPKEFRSANDVARALDASIKEIGLEKELEKFECFYDGVRSDAAKFEHTGGKQAYIKKIYGNFLLGFDKLAQKAHGVVYTPDEVIDFIIHSTEHVLRTEFGTGFGRKNVKVFDPFTGTGAFVTKLLESGLIRKDRLLAKYAHDIWASEINLLAYYVASVNIESAFGEACGSNRHEPFRNINYTDTLNHHPRYRQEKRHRHRTKTLHGDLKKVDENIERGNWSHIHIIMGNPPYSAGQDDYGKQRPNEKYPKLDERIKDTYINRAKKFADLRRAAALYDSYIRSIRWASDRIGRSGIVAFVTNAGFLRSKPGAGVRACLAEEFSDIWCFDLRGNATMQGEERKKEGGGIFGAGSRAPVAITILVKNPKKKRCTIRYKDIGDYLSREEKLAILKNAKFVEGITDWQVIRPNKHHDWLAQRGKDGFEKYTPLGSKDTKSGKDDNALFRTYSGGVSTSRDVWVYNSSTTELTKNMKRHIKYCNFQDLNNPVIDPTQGKWSRALSKRLLHAKLPFDGDKIRTAVYRPFFKQHLYFDHVYNEVRYQIPKLFPRPDTQNPTICVSDKGKSGMFSALITNVIPDLHIIEQSQCFPLYVYDGADNKNENLADWALSEYRNHYGDPKITKKDVFYYVYGMLHHPGYRRKFKDKLKHELPHIPMAPDFWSFSRIGMDLASLHLSYETCKRHKLGAPIFDPAGFQKLDFGRKDAGKGDRRSTVIDHRSILADRHLLFDGIPEMEYRVNGKTPVGWVVDRYAVKKNPDSGIVNDPCTGTDIVAVLERAVHVGLESDRLVSELPKEFEPREGWEPRRTGMDKFFGSAE